MMALMKVSRWPALALGLVSGLAPAATPITPVPSQATLRVAAVQIRSKPDRRDGFERCRRLFLPTGLDDAGLFKF